VLLRVIDGATMVVAWDFLAEGSAENR